MRTAKKDTIDWNPSEMIRKQRKMSYMAGMSRARLIAAAIGAAQEDCAPDEFDTVKDM